MQEKTQDFTEETAVEETVVEEAAKVEETVTEEPVAAEEPATAEENAPVQEQYVPEVTIQPESKKKSKLKIIIPIIIAVLAVVGVVLAAIFLLGSKSNAEPRLFFIKDNTLYIAEDGDYTEATIVTEMDDEDDEFGLNETITTNYAQLCGDKLYFGSKFDEGTCTLYCKDLKSEEDAEKIDTNIALSFVIDEKGERIVYVKNDNLYLNDLKADKKIKLATDVQSWCTNDEVTVALYSVANEDSDLFSLYKTDIAEGSEAEKISTDISEIINISDDLSEIYFIKNDSIYLATPENDAEKIVTNVDNIISFGGKDEIYFTRADEKGLEKKAFFDDDAAEKDAKIKKPNKEDYRIYYYYYSYISDAYYDALDAYEYKLNRDKVREMAKETFETKSLYCYNGEEETLVGEDVGEVKLVDGNHIVFEQYDSSKIKKFKMSDLSEIDEFADFVNSARGATKAVKYAHNGKIVDVKIEKAYGFCVNGENDTLNFIGDVKEDKDKKSFGTIQNITFDEEGAATVNNLYDDAYILEGFDNQGNVIYFKNVTKDGAGDLYIGEDEISIDVSTDDICLYDDKILFLKDCEKETGFGTLCIGNAEDVTEIDYDVYIYSTEANGEIFYAKDYDDNAETYDLYVYDGEESVLVKKEISYYTMNYGSTFMSSNKADAFNVMSNITKTFEDVFAEALEDAFSDFTIDLSAEEESFAA